MSPKSVFITGGNRGIGLEFVRQFLALSPTPKHVFATCRQPENAPELNQLAKDNSNLHIVKLDVTDYSTLPAIVSKVEAVVGSDGLNVLVNNAGILRQTKLEDVTVEEMRAHFETNSVAPLMITKALLPLLKKGAAAHGGSELSLDKGAVVSVSSMMGSISDNTSGSLYAYRASKASLNIISKSLACDLKADGILSFVLSPGWVSTDMGGKNARMTPEQCVTGLMRSMKKVDVKTQHLWQNYKDTTEPW